MGWFFIALFFLGLYFINRKYRRQYNQTSHGTFYFIRFKKPYYFDLSTDERFVSCGKWTQYKYHTFKLESTKDKDFIKQMIQNELSLNENDFVVAGVRDVAFFGAH